MDNNRALLCGRVSQPPAFSHNIHDKNLYECKLLVPRLSGNADTVAVLLPETFVPLMQGQITVEGQLRGYTRQESDRRHLRLMVLARQVRTQQAAENNRIELEGVLVRPPLYRVTPLGREIADLMLRVTRNHGGADYIPCIVWGRCARFAENLKKGEWLRVVGRMQSRAYNKALADGTVESRTAYELSINHLTRLPNPAPIVPSAPD